MTIIGSYDAKTHLPALLRRVEAGESLTITRHGRPIARLVPVPTPDAPTPAEAAASLRRLRRRMRLGEGLSVRELLDRDRR